ncbi:site-specific DNA-methyltransferase [Moraxella nasicaprae]|uniref:site-specific DNA-methyltransferase (adenine-specific) n=1 Tax=Moraxella nasicaprae TaxID=2904122 RepID=A0ABY6F3C6_9GAMM|nr:site-specific DNA-methyltransferase [Moraxella nasicaprae]UXZ04588.1 site-specific DNA-methyltransferase [Moraxella nasicaprae]
MQLTYPNKKSAEEILTLAENYTLPINDCKLPVLFFGDNFRVLSYLLNNGFKNKIDLIYIDPPYNTEQDFTLSFDRVSTISRSKTDIVAYRDNWTINEYLEFMRERLILMRELLSEQGSIYVHIDGKMGHYLKIIMDEVFGIENFKNDIARIKSNPKNFSRKAFGNEKDMILFYAKNAKKNIFNQITAPLTDDEKQTMFEKIDENGRRYNTVPVHAPGETLRGETGGLWRDMLPPKGRHWRCSPSELDELDRKGLIEWSKNGVPRIKKFADEHKGKKIQDIWRYKDPMYPDYPTQKNSEMLEMIIAQSSNPHSIVMDCFAGSGSFLKASSKLGRQWIGVDASDVAIQIIQTQLEHLAYQFIDVNQQKSQVKEPNIKQPNEQLTMAF